MTNMLFHSMFVTLPQPNLINKQIKSCLQSFNSPIKPYSLLESNSLLRTRQPWAKILFGEKKSSCDNLQNVYSWSYSDAF